jgi:hypothetical protein
VRAAHNNGRAVGGNGAAFLPRFMFVVERMHVTGKGRTWHQIGEPHRIAELALQAAEKVTRFEALTTRVRPVIL